MSRPALLQAKLNALVKWQWGAQPAAEHAPFPGGAGLRPTKAGAPAYVLVDRATHRSLGGVLAWALHYEAGKINFLADASPETCALLQRRAEPFSPPVKLWRVDAGGVVEVAPAPFSPPLQLPPQDAAFAAVLRDAGAEPVVEFGVLTGEVLGLEVARVVAGRLEVGVGSQDRRARQEVQADRDPKDQLAEVVALIRRYRTPAGAAHLANSLSPERWLRAALVARPALVGAAWLAPRPPAVASTDLRLPNPALAAGVDLEDRPVVVATSSGIDLDLVPAAADGWRASGLDAADARLILVMVAEDAHPRTRQLAALLRHPAEVVTVPAEWKSLAGTL